MKYLSFQPGDFAPIWLILGVTAVAFTQHFYTICRPPTPGSSPSPLQPTETSAKKNPLEPGANRTYPEDQLPVGSGHYPRLVPTLLRALAGANRVMLYTVCLL